MRKPVVAVNCTVTPNGVVIPAAGFEGSYMRDGPYRGRCRFHYAPGGRGEPDEVRVLSPSEGATTATATTQDEETYFYFALRASWTYGDSSDPSVDFSSDTNYPMFESVITDAVNVAQGLVGKSGFTDPPPLAANPFKRTSISDTTDIQVFADVASGTSTYTLNALWFYRGKLIPSAGVELDDGAGLGTATPAHAGSVLTGGTWQVLWDVYTFDGGSTYTFVETKTYGPFTVPDTAVAADHTTWASVSPSDSWAITLGVDDDVVFRNLRIEQVT